MPMARGTISPQDRQRPNASATTTSVTSSPKVAGEVPFLIRFRLQVGLRISLLKVAVVELTRYQRTKRTDAAGGIHVWGYDDAGNLLTETDEDRPLQSTLKYAYDPAGNRTSVMDQPGRDDLLIHLQQKRPAENHHHAGRPDRPGLQLGQEHKCCPAQWRDYRLQLQRKQLADEHRGAEIAQSRFYGRL